MWDKFITSLTSCLPHHIMFRSPAASPAMVYFASICGPHLLSISPIGEVDHFAYSKTPSSGRILLLHNPYNWKMFSIWHSHMFTPRSPGYTSIVGRPNIKSYFFYSTLHSPTIKRPLPIKWFLKFYWKTNGLWDVKAKEWTNVSENK